MRHAVFAFLLSALSSAASLASRTTLSDSEFGTDGGIRGMGFDGQAFGSRPPPSRDHVGDHDRDIVGLRRRVEHIFYHAYDNYMAHAFPHDELRYSMFTMASAAPRNFGDASVVRF